MLLEHNNNPILVAQYIPILEALMTLVPNPLKQDDLTPLFCLFDLQVEHDAEQHQIHIKLKAVQDPYLLHTGKHVVVDVPAFSVLQLNEDETQVIHCDLPDPHMWFEQFIQTLTTEHMVTSCFALPTKLIVNPNNVLKIVKYLCNYFLINGKKPFLQWEPSHDIIYVGDSLNEIMVHFLHQHNLLNKPFERKTYKIDADYMEFLLPNIEYLTLENNVFSRNMTFKHDYSSIFEPLQFFGRILKEASDPEYQEDDVHYFDDLLDDEMLFHRLSSNLWRNKESEYGILFGSMFVKMYYDGTTLNVKQNGQNQKMTLRREYDIDLWYDLYHDQWFIYEYRR